MNMLDLLGLARKFLDIYKKASHLKPGETLPFSIKTRLGGRMWVFRGTAGPEA